MRFTDKVALVTGSGRGIGKATALRFAQEKAEAVILVDLASDRLAQAKQDVEATGSKVLAFEADVTNSKRVNELVAQAKDQYGRIDVLVNNVGASWGEKGLDVTESDWDDIIELNLKSQFLLCKAVVPIMKTNGSGRIVNISSSSARYRSQGFAGHPYIAGKAGVSGFTRQLAFELAEHNITVNSVVPGNVGTEEGLKDWEEAVKSSPKQTAFIMDSTPMKRLAKPEELASAIAFLASDDASYITGVSLDVNGGLWMA